MKQVVHTYYYLPLLLWLFFAASLQVCIADENAPASGEYALKAVCLYNFSQFTKWPAEKDPKKSIIISVVGHSPFGDAIEKLQTLLEKTNKKNITIVYHGPYRKGIDLRGSHLLFISSSEKKNMRKIVASLKEAPVLTVSDADGFLEAGGMISLVLLKNKVRWEINRGAIDLAELHISAKLLQLAIRIENIPEQSELLPYKFDRKNRWFILKKAYASLPEFFISLRSFHIPV